MKEVRILEIRQSVFADNDRQAGELRAELKEKGVFLLNLMSSPGAGKTTTLMKTIEALKDTFRMTRQGLKGLETGDIDLAILENVGNLVCPAEFDTGAAKNAMILSVPEGDDKPLKYPLMFSVCDVVLINKIDVLPYFDFDLEKCKESISMRNPKAKVIPICAKTGEGMEGWTGWLREQVRMWKEK